MTSKKALITGINGMDGKNLCDFLLKKNYEVYGLIRNEEKIKDFEKNKNLKFFVGDLIFEKTVRDICNQVSFDEVYHLGGQTKITPSWEDPMYSIQVNSNPVLFFIQEILKNKNIKKLFFASSSEVFGNPTSYPQNEDTQLNPRNPYGISKKLGMDLIKLYREKFDVFACSGILFTHEDNNRENIFLSRKISNGVAKIFLGLEDKITLGNIEDERDWSSSKDFVEGMWLVMQQDIPSDYIFSSFQSKKVSDFLDIAFKCVNIINWEKHIKIDETLKRPKENKIIGDNTKLKSIGWRPKISFEDMVKNMVFNDINILKSKI